jgi:hypothetical protein
MNVFDIEFWSSHCREKFNEAYDNLKNHGYSEEEAINMLEELYHAVSNECGA